MDRGYRRFGDWIRAFACVDGKVRLHAQVFIYETNIRVAK